MHSNLLIADYRVKVGPDKLPGWGSLFCYLGDMLSVTVNWQPLFVKTVEEVQGAVLPVLTSCHLSQEPWSLDWYKSCFPSKTFRNCSTTTLLQSDRSALILLPLCHKCMGLNSQGRCMFLTHESWRDALKLCWKVLICDLCNLRI